MIVLAPMSSPPPPRLPLVGCLLLLLAALAGAPAGAQTAREPARVETLEQLSYSLRHQPASDALDLVHGLLSERGSVQFHSGDNRLVVVDSPERVGAILHLLREFDHPPRPLRFSVQILRASRHPTGPSGDPTIAPPELAQRLRQLLRYDYYTIVAEAELEALEGKALDRAMGRHYRLQFDVGTVIQQKRLKLRNFRIIRDDGERRRTFNANLNLWLGNTLALALTQDEASESGLVVAITSHLVE